MRILIATLLITVLTQIPVAAADLPTVNDAACRIATAPGRHLGKTFRFRAQFVSDYRERARLRPLGCEFSFPAGLLSEQAESLIVPRGFRPLSEKIVVTVQGRLVQREANGSQFQHDDGVRLDVIRAEEIQVFDVGYPRRFH